MTMSSRSQRSCPSTEVLLVSVVVVVVVVAVVSDVVVVAVVSVVVVVAVVSLDAAARCAPKVVRTLPCLLPYRGISCLPR